MASPVFKEMFGKNLFKECVEQEAELPGKTLTAAIWMLDYIYPEIQNHRMFGKPYQLCICINNKERSGAMF